MEELKELLKIRKCHFSLEYSSIVDFFIKLWIVGYNDDGSDLVIFQESSWDFDYLVSKCKVVYKDWLNENEGGY